MTQLIGSSAILTPDPATENGVTVETNNVSALEQVDKRGNMQNLIYFDADDNLFLGPLREPKIQLFTTTPLNLTVRHIVWDFNETAIPAGLNFSSTHGGNYDFVLGDSRINLNTAAVAAGDAVSLQANNILTKTDRPTRVYFTLNLFVEDRNTDLQFGVRSADGNNVIAFRYAAASNAHDVIKGMLYNGGTVHYAPTSYNDITGRHLYCLEWEANGDIHFYIGDNINNLQLAGTFLASDSAKPSASASLLPFIQLRTNDQAGYRTVALDTIYSILAW